MANLQVASPSAAGSTEASVMLRKARKTQGQISPINFSFVAISVRFFKSNADLLKKKKKKLQCLALFISKCN